MTGRPVGHLEHDEAQRAREAAERQAGDFERVEPNVALAALRSAQAAHARKKALVIPGQCGGCGLDSPRMRACMFVGDKDCKHSPQLEARAAKRARAARMRAGGVPQKFWPEVEAIDECEALAAVRRVLVGEAMICIILGGPGAGKSLSASRAVADLGGLFTPASALAGGEEKVEGLMRTIYEEPLVVLDDVGRARSATPAAIERVEEILCIRYDKKLPTIVTANLLPWRSTDSSPPGFWDVFGGEHGRIADRLGGAEKVAICTEQSRRRIGDLFSSPPPGEKS